MDINFHYYTIAFVTESELTVEAAKRITKYILKYLNEQDAVVLCKSQPMAAGPVDFPSE